jgi:competence protein ComEC
LPAGLAASIAATTFCLPIIFAISGQFSLVAIVANSVVEPAVAPVTVIGFIAALTATISAVAAHWLLIIALPFANWIAWWAKFFAAAPVMLLPPGIVGALAAVLLILMLVKIRFRRAKIALAIVIVISLLAYWLPGQSWPGDNWRIVNCDVGQGDGAVLNLGGGAGVVIDAGPDANLMASCLDDLGIKRVPLLILTHFHADHVAGLAGVLRARLIENIWITNYDQPLFDYQATMALLQGRAVTVVHSGQVATMPSKFGELRISVLWPKSEVSNFAALPGDGSSINNQSIALTLREPGFSYFTGGDIEPPAQSEILNSGMAGPVMAMKISHHGSAYQDLALLDLLHPQVAVISVGAGNSYGHPAPMTISALRQRNIEVFRTDLDGAIALAVSGSKVVARLKSKNILSWG